ncbi:DUF3822 family protein [Coprobacter sp.]
MGDSIFKIIPPENTESYTLSIRLRNDGCYFAISNPEVNNSYRGENIIFTPNGNTLLRSIEETVYNHPVLLRNFRKIYIIIQSSRFTFIPKAIEEKEEKLNAYYDFCFPNHTDKILCNEWKKNQLYNLFGVEKDSYAFLKRTFDNPVFLHQLTPLCEYFYNRSRTGNNSKMYVHLQKGWIDIACFNKAGMLFANSFEYGDIHDAAYYILNVWEQQQFDQETDELQLTGDKTPRQIITRITQEYIRQVMPSIFPPQLFKLGKETLEAPFDLTVIPLCEL